MSSFRARQQKNAKILKKVLLFLMVAICLFSKKTLAECTECNDLESKIAQKNGEKGRYEALLKSNEAYLEEVGKNDVSKRIKLRSNVMVISLRLEAVRNDLDFLMSSDFQAKCKSCTATKSKPQVKE